MFRTMMRTGVAACLLAAVSVTLLATPADFSGPDAPRLIGDFVPRELRDGWMESVSGFSAIDPSGGAVARAGSDGEVQIWDAKQGAVSSILADKDPKENAETELIYSANGQTLVALDNPSPHGDPSSISARLRVWTLLASSRHLVQIALSGSMFALSPDGRHIAGVAKLDQAVSIWDTRSGKVVGKVPATMEGSPSHISGRIAGMVFTPDGKELVLYDSYGKRGLHRFLAFEIAAATETPPRAAGRIIGRTYERAREIRGKSLSRTCMSFLNGGKTLVTLSSPAPKPATAEVWHLRYWDMLAGGEQQEAKSFPRSNSVERMAVSLYGSTLAITTGGRYRVQILDLATGKLRNEITFPSGVNVNALFVDATGRYLGAATSDSRVHAWELASPPAGGSPEAAKPVAATGAATTADFPQAFRDGVSTLVIAEPGKIADWSSLKSLKHLTDLTCQRPLSVEQAGFICSCGQLTSLSFSGNPDITDAHLGQLANCRQLARLHLSGTSVTGAFLSTLPRAGTGGAQPLPLHSLDLSNTPVTDEALEFLVSRAPALEWLDLSETKITDDGLRRVAQLPRLKSLNLQLTGVTDRGLAHLSGLKYLEDLDLLWTEITPAGLGQLRGLSTLKELVLPPFIDAMDEADPSFDPRRYEVADQIVAQLSSLNNLKVIAPQIWTFSDEGLRHLSMLTSLSEIMVQGNRFTPAGLRHLKRMPRLDTIRFQWTIKQPLGLTDEGLAELKDMPQLRCLDIWNAYEPQVLTNRGLEHMLWTEITPAGLEHLKNLTNLETLVLHGIDISDAGLAKLAGLKRLQTLAIFSTHVTVDGILKLRGATGLRRLFLFDVEGWPERKSELVAAFPHLEENPDYKTLMPTADR